MALGELTLGNLAQQTTSEKRRAGFQVPRINLRYLAMVLNLLPVVVAGCLPSQATPTKEKAMPPIDGLVQVMCALGSTTARARMSLQQGTMVEWRSNQLVFDFTSPEFRIKKSDTTTFSAPDNEGFSHLQPEQEGNPRIMITRNRAIDPNSVTITAEQDCPTPDPEENQPDIEESGQGIGIN